MSKITNEGFTRMLYGSACMATVCFKGLNKYATVYTHRLVTPLY